jgi:hypothetical protein
VTTDRSSANTAPPAGGEAFAPLACPVGHGVAVQGGGEPSTVAGRGGSARHGRSGRGYFVPGLIALVAMAAVGGAVNFAGLDHSSPSRLAGPDVATFVAQGIQTEDRLASPPPVVCPASEPVRTGLRFACRWQRQAGDRIVNVTETDSRGQFRFAVVSAGG